MRLTNRPIIAIVGLGEWGEKLVRIATHLNVPIHGFDIESSKTRRIKRLYPMLETHTSAASLLNDARISAVMIATPPLTHYMLSRRALIAGKHVLIEKPMTQSVSQAQALTTLATASDRIIMVDHTYIFSPALTRVRRLVHSDFIGRLIRIESVRNGGHPRKDSSVLWDFAPHDITIAQFLMGALPTGVQTLALPYKKNTLLDDATIQLVFTDSDVRYLAHVSWNDSTKTRSLICVGEKASLTLSWDGTRETLTHDVSGTRRLIHTAQKEPLEEMFLHFISSIRSGKQPVSNGEMGYQVVRIIAALHESWKNDGAKIIL